MTSDLNVSTFALAVSMALDYSLFLLHIDAFAPVPLLFPHLGTPPPFSLLGSSMPQW